MTQSWRSNPQFKLECSGETFINTEALSILNVRAENNVDYIVLTVGDYKSKNYVDVFDGFDVAELSLRYGSDSWTKVFEGNVSTVRPQLSKQGEVLGVTAWSNAIGSAKTYCNTSYGLESERPTKDTPKEILVDLATWFINRSFGSATTTGWSWGTGNVEDVHNGLSVTHLPGLYQDNFTMINRLCDIVNAYAAGLPQVGIHWIIQPSASFYVKKIDADAADGNWDRYWGGTVGTDPGTQASSTIVVKKDMILYDFRKNVEEYANRVVLCTGLRIPAYDRLTEYDGVGAGGSNLWGTDNSAVSDDGATKVVGSYSLQIDSTGAANAEAYYPSTEDIGWDIEKCGSENTIPYIGFYFQKNATVTFANVNLFTTDHSNDFFHIDSIQALGSGANGVWDYFRFPIGPYWSLSEENVRFRWASNGAPDWADINGITFTCNGHAVATSEMYIDDLHITGKIIREASDTSELAGADEYQRVIINNTAFDDTLKASDASGLAGRLVYADLLRRAQTPIVGMIQMPMAVDLLPGQIVHIHACQKSDDTYRIDKDMRVKELRHVIGKGAPYGGFATILNLTDDVTNTHAFGVPTQQSLLLQYAGALGHAEARDLKSSGIDTLIPRLTKAYA